MKNTLISHVFIAFSIFAGMFSTSTAKTVDLKITTYNVEWLSCDENGPDDEGLQENNIVTVIQTINPDIIALQEVGTSSNYAPIDTLVKKLGINEWGGIIIPSSSQGNCGQNVAIIYQKSKIQVLTSSLLSSSTDDNYTYNWSGGRYPSIHTFNLISGDDIVPFSVVNIHAKAMSDESSYNRRIGASEGLKTILDGNQYNTKNIIFVGDFNDYLVGTQAPSGTDSPYKNFMDDTQNYRGLTSGLTDPYYSYNPVIDNIIISNELFSNYVANSVIREISASNIISNYRSTTSDHTPVSALFRFSFDDGGSGSCESINFSETFANNLGEFTDYDVTGLQSWQWRDNYGAYGSGYSAGTNYENEDWLVSPVFDLSNSESATLSFDHALNFSANAYDKENNHTVWVSSNYEQGNPNLASWTQLSIPTMASGDSWAYINSGNIAIPTQFMTENIHFAFKYLSTSSVAGTWEIKNLLFNAVCKLSSINDQTTSNSNIYASNNEIKIDLNEPADVWVYDIMGQNIFSNTVQENITIPMLPSGIYIVHIGNTSQKIVVR
ncbi:MAG: choice-of-anchor J domain-containing protein [Paludibacteraceae bacterium]|nr:choice-of-anchor J domain-containing protein [Paludibacteraceae bacterium]